MIPRGPLIAQRPIAFAKYIAICYGSGVRTKGHPNARYVNISGMHERNSQEVLNDYYRREMDKC